MGVAPSTSNIAAHLGLEHVGPEVVLRGTDALGEADPDELAFCVYDDPDLVRASNAGAVICPPSVPPTVDGTLLYAERPKLAFVRAAREFFVSERTESAVHPTAVVESGAAVGERCVIGANAYVADCVTLGDDCTVQPGCVIGSPGFGFVRDQSDELHRVPHQGSVRVESGVEIGANSRVDRAVFEETVVGAGSKLSSGVHLAHQVRIGRDVTVAFGCGMAGGVEVGDRATLHPHVSVATDVTVGDDTEIGMNSAVLDDVPAGTTVVGSPATAVVE